MSTTRDNLIWIDLEMTGLQSEDRIIEIATIVTDSDLNELAEGPVFVIHQADNLLANMDDWNTEHHTNSGLIERVKASQINEKFAETETIAFLKQYALEGKSPMCGNSVWQDRRFLSRYMPLLEKYFHYRMIDVSTLKELALRWAPQIYQGVQKESRHRALDDIRESIEELKYYRSEFLRIN
ncbi:MAG: oligoribonuclease [Gammaproteobacteria bacterium RIFCSPHIGHO2_12_FULL_37_14]|nr:MAG: oligoribonuclease [Gammaproteobacteria bacterium RIFCSPHIGHO2_12_FULL_37_14]